MKYDEATKLIKGLSKKYSICEEKNSYRVTLKDTGFSIIEVSEIAQYAFNRCIGYGYGYFDKLPYSHKLWMILAELAMTPISEREEHK